MNQNQLNDISDRWDTNRKQHNSQKNNAENPVDCNKIFKRKPRNFSRGSGVFIDREVILLPQAAIIPVHSKNRSTSLTKNYAKYRVNNKHEILDDEILP